MSTRSTAAAAAAAAVRARGRGHKERSKNFTELEKRTVLELIAQHCDVLRQGRSNNATNKNKQLVWSSICEEVNKRCGGDRPRTPAQVKMWYENYKKKCKMRAQEPSQPEGSSILDGMLWQSIHPLDVKDEEQDLMESGSVNSGKDDDCLPVNMSNGRLSTCNTESDDTLTNVLEPHVQIIPQSTTPPLVKNPIHNPIPTLSNHLQIITNPIHALQQAEFARMQKNYVQNLNELNAPLNLSHLDHSDSEPNRKSSSSDKSVHKSRQETRNYEAHTFKHDCESTATEEERLYFSAKRQHAIWEHEAKMKILNMELRQKEEIFSLQKQLFLIELKLKMDFLEKSCAK